MNEAEVALLLEQSGLGATLIPILSALAVGAGSLLAVFAWTPRIQSRAVKLPRQTSYRDHVPFLGIEDDGITVVCEGKKILRTWRLAGIDHAGMSRNQRLALAATRASLLNAIAASGSGPSIEIRMISRRSPPPPDPETSASHSDAEEDTEAPRALREITSRWSRHIGSHVRRNRHWLVLSTKDSPAGREALSRCHQLIDARLPEYGPKLLKVGNDLDSPLEPYAMVVSPAASAITDPAGSKAPMNTGKKGSRLEDEADIRDLVAADEALWLGRGKAEFRHGDRTRCMAIVQTRGLPEEMGERTMQELLRIQGSLVVLQTAQSLPKTVTSVKLGIEARRASWMPGSGRASEELLQAMEELESGAEGHEPAELWQWSMTVLCLGDDMDAADATAQSVERVLGLQGFQTVRGGMAAEAGFWSIFPNWPVARPWRILSHVLAQALLPQTAPSGIESHDWAPRCLVPFRTVEGSRFGFTLHPRADKGAPGHVCVIGPTGEGKTTLLSFIAAHVLAIHDSTVWLLDRHRGMEIFCRTAGGAYIDVIGAGAEGDRASQAGDDIHGVQQAQLNPFAISDTPANRAFLRHWVAELAGGRLSPQDDEAVARMIRTCFQRIPPELRTMSRLFPASFRTQSDAAKALRPWIDDDRQGRVFSPKDGAEDSLDRFQDRLIGLDMTQALEIPPVASALVSYLMHRVRTRTPGRPTFLCIDETEPMLESPGFRTFLKQGLQEGRKLRHAYAVCFQRPAAAAPISDLLRGQCQTMLFLRNSAGSKEDYEPFELTEGDLDFVLGRSHRDLRHAALCKRYEGPDTAVLDTGLYALGNWARVLSSDRSMVESYRRLVAAHGADKALEKLVSAA